MKFNKFNLITTVLYIVAFILILLNFLTPYLNLAALILFTIASFMLSISTFKFCKTRNAILSSGQEEVVMELSMEDGMEKYVPVEKKKNGFKRSIELCKQYDVYRQNYCGCIFSLKEAQERMKDMELKSENQLDKELKEDLKGIHAANN